MQTEPAIHHADAVGEQRTSAVQSFLRAFARIFEGLRLYGADHPATRRSAEEASGLLRAAAPGEGPIQFSLGQDRLLLDGHELPADRALSGLIADLNSARVAVLTIDDVLEAPKLVALASALALRPAGSHWGEPDDRALADAVGTAVAVVTVSYASLAARDMEEHALGDDHFRWGDLVRAIAGGGGASALGSGPGMQSRSGAGDETPAIIAGLDRRLGTDAVGAAEALAGAVGPIAGMADPGERSAAFGRLSRAISGLGPEARRRLVAIDASSPARSLAALAELSQVLPAEDVIQALEGLGSGGSLPCTESLRLLSRLAFATRGDPRLTDEVRRTADRIVGRLGVRPDDEERANTLRSFRRLLERTGESKYNPDDYEGLISSLAKDGAAPAVGPNGTRLAEGWDDERLHAATLAASLAADPETHANDAAGVLRRLHDGFGVLAGAGRIDLLAEAARAADAMLGATCSPEATGAIKRFVLSLRTAQSIGALLAAAPPGDPRNTHVAAIVRLGGVEALVGALCACAARSDARAEIVAMLREPAGRGVDGAAALAQIGRTEPQTAAWLLRAGVTPIALLNHLVGGLVSNPDPAISEDAFLGLHAASAHWTADQVALAAGHPSDRVRSLAIDHACGLDTPRRTDILAGLLLDSPSTRLPAPLARRATAHLLECGDEGMSRAIEVFGSLARRPTPRRLAAASALLGAIGRAPGASSRLGGLRLFGRSLLAIMGATA